MKSSEIWNELGNTYFKVGEFDKAIDAYCKAIEQKSQSGWSYSNLAAIYVQNGRFLDAIPLYQKSLELFSNRKDQAAAWGRLGSVYRHLNEHGKAIQAYQKADEIMPRRVAGQVNLTLQERGLADPEVETAVLREAQPIQPNWNHSSDAELLAMEDDNTPGNGNESSSLPMDLSADDLSVKTEVQEENASVWNELGLVLFKVGVYDDAIDAFKKAINLEPAVGFFHSNLGQVYVAQGRLTEAIVSFENSVRLLPNNKDKAVSWTRLGDIYRQMGKYDEGMAAYKLADALGQAAPVPTNEYRTVGLEFIVTNLSPLRELKEIDDLAVSIRKYGIIQPLIVCPSRNEPGKYILIAGRRRFEAARQIGLKEVPVIVRQASEQEILELSINENIHSVAIDPFELAQLYRQMVNDFDLSVEDIAGRVGRSCHSIANTMKVLEQPAEKQADESSDVETRPLAAHTMVKPSFGNDGVARPVMNNCGAEMQTDSEGQIKSLRAGASAKSESVPTLWYLETETDSSASNSEDESSSEGISLLARARHALKCNPHAKRLWASPSYRA